MKILLVSPCFPPQETVASMRTHSFARTWSAAGHKVTVLTTRKRSDQGALQMPCAGFDCVEIDYATPWYLEGMRARYKAASRHETPRRRGLLQRIKERTGIFSSVRMPDLTDYWVNPAVEWAKANGAWDVVVSSSGPYTAHLVARAVKRYRLAQRWLADYRDLWTENHIYSGLFPFTWKEAREEKACLAEMDLIVTVSSGLAEKLRRRTKARVEIIYNGFDPESHAQLTNEPAFPADGRRRIAYTGTLYPQGQNPRGFLQALTHLVRETPRLADRLSLAIAGPSLPVWSELIPNELRPCVDLRGAVDHQLALRMQRDADALLLVDWHDPSAGVMTSKVFEYLQASAPILLVGSPEGSLLAELVSRAGRGIVLPKDHRQTSALLKRWLESPRSICPEPDRAFIHTLSRTRQALRFLDFFESLVPDAERSVSHVARSA